jgi:hypothetical protein
VATSDQIRRRGRWSLVLGTVVASIAVASVASADDIANNLDASVDATAEVMPLTQGGANGTTRLYVVPRNGDGKNGCNLTGSTTLSVSVGSSNTSVATVSPASITFTSCVAEPSGPTVTVTPHNVGSATISLSQTSNTTGATFNLTTATFTVTVSPPPNTPPMVSVAGVTGGASYDKGSVPTAMCNVTDTEDGNSSFPATLSAISGPYAADGIGEQTASCSYTDTGGLTASAAVTYGVVDPSGPTIGYSISGTLGNDGWYTSDVGLTWNVTENESPSSLVETGCVDQSITADQAAAAYSCSATSAGGSTGPVSVSLKRDATKPTIAGVASPAANGDGWNNSDVTVAFTCTDNLSGVASCGPDQTLSSEGRDLSVTGTAVDAAGNSEISTVGGIDIDRTAPDVTASTSATPIDVAGVDWFKDSVTFVWSAVDPALADASAGSGVKTGPAPATSAFNTTGTGLSASSQATDYAGNPGSGSVSGVNVDATAPTAQFVDCPSSPLILGSPASTVHWTAADIGSGLASASSGSVTLDTSSVGSKTAYSPAPEDNVGHTGTPASCTYTVGFNFAGLFAPIDRPNTMNVSKAGQAIPLKWRLTDYFGNPVTSLASITVKVASIACSYGSGTPDEVEEYAAGSSGLQNLGDGYYQFNWKTPTSYAGSCKQLNLDLGEGTLRTNLALISFKK